MFAFADRQRRPVRHDESIRFGGHLPAVFAQLIHQRPNNVARLNRLTEGDFGSPERIFHGELLGHNLDPLWRIDRLDVTVKRTQYPERIAQTTANKLNFTLVREAAITALDENCQFPEGVSGCGQGLASSRRRAQRRKGHAEVLEDASSHDVVLMIPAIAANIANQRLGNVAAMEVNNNISLADDIAGQTVSDALSVAPRRPTGETAVLIEAVLPG